jgi:catechol 2,3-dioxygenase-like lactoylglutathione lyase family enzyme
MIDHVSIGVRSISVSKRFYDRVFKPLGYEALSESAGSLGYGAGRSQLWMYETDRPVVADEKSGLHFCFIAPTRKSVDEFHAAALTAGGRDHGRPGLREDYGANYYAAFVIDPDGYRLEAYCSKAG